MSFVLVARTPKSETYQIRCDKCGAITDEVEVQRPDAQPVQYQKSFLQKAREIVAKMTKDSGMQRVGKKHFCEDTCYVPPKKATQGTLFDKEVMDKIIYQPWVD